MAMNVSEYEAPDGGWGWLVVLAFAINNFLTIPIMQGFGLIYKEEFQILGISVTDATVITNMNAAFGMIFGLGNGRLIRNYGYRKTAIAGAILYASGIIGTSFATTFVQFIVLYGMISSYGMGLSMLSYGIALNTYFRTKRSQAVGIYTTFTALGPILMPPLQSLLLSKYGAQGTMLILGGLSLNSLISALLLQPIKWHGKKTEHIKITDDQHKDEAVTVYLLKPERENSDVEKHTDHNDPENPRRKRTTTVSSSDLNAESASIYGYETPMSSNLALFSIAYCKSSDTINLGSSMKIFNDTENSVSYPNHEKHFSEKLNGLNTENKSQISPDRTNSSEVNKPERRSKMKKWFLAVVRFFDLGLLRDPTYVNLMLGMSIALLAEMNFSALTPFILSDMSLNTSQIAVVMSVIGIGDLIFRALWSFIGKYVKQSFRMMYTYSLLLLIITRSTLTVAENYTAILGVTVFLGIAKGLRSVYMPLIIPDYIKSVERLASASSIQMLCNGCFLLTAGPLIGLIRDISDNYTPAIMFINSITMLTIVMWYAEIITKKLKTKTKSPNI